LLLDVNVKLKTKRIMAKINLNAHPIKNGLKITKNERINEYKL
tara:strand:- start:53 stop:181 length:129 start_codon:yes stop_codon:yes gene_type:complete